MRSRPLSIILGATLASACAPPPSPVSTDAPAAAAKTIVGPDAVTVATTLVADRTDLVMSSRHRSLVGDHVRFRKVARDGTRIVGREAAVHLQGAAPAWSRAVIDDDHPTPFHLVGERRIDDATAEARARAAIELAPKQTITDVTVERAALPITPSRSEGDADRDAVRAGFRVVVETRSPARGWEVWVDGDGGAEVRRDIYMRVDGTGLVFDPNPIMQTGDLTLVDGNDVTTTALDAARIAVTLPRLDGTQVLSGQFADVRPKGALANRATSATHDFSYDRADDRFEEVNAYYHLDAAQAKLQALGFTDANNRIQVAIANGTNDDNSFYNPQNKTITFGDGGVDDAEDADIVVHEYGHAIHDNIVPGWGTSQEANAIGEGFGDLLAAALEPIDAVGHPPGITRACVGSWDATSYDSRTPPCLRRIDEPKHFPESATGEVHDDGEIWASACTAIIAAIGDPAIGLSLIVESFYGVPVDVTFAGWAASLLAADQAMHTGAHVDLIKRILWERGLHRVPLEPGLLSATPMSKTVDLGPMALASNVDASLMINEPGAGAIRVHFSAFAMESDPQCFETHCDNVYVFDGQGQLFGVLGGALGASDGPVVPGDTVVLRWITDGSVNSPGFHIDRYDYGAGTPPGAEVTEPPLTLPDAGNAVTGEGGGGCCDAGNSPGGGTLAGLVVVLGLIRPFRRRRPRPLT